MEKKKYLYIVPRKKFFSEGYRGRVMHALGIAEGLCENGYEVDFIGGKDLKSFMSDLPNGINLIELDEGSGIFSSLKWNLKIMKTLKFLLSKNHYEAIIIRYAISSYILLLIISFFSKQTKKVMEVNTFAYQAFFVKNLIINKIISTLEIFLISRYNLLYAVSESMAVDIKNKNFKGNVVAIPNGSSSKQIDFTNVNHFMTKTRLVYLGSIMPYWDYRPIIEALKNSDNLYELHFIGSGPMEEYIKKQIGDLIHVEFHGQFNRNNLGNLLNPSTDILYLPPVALADMKRTGGLSTKAFDYLSMKLPIIGPSDGELNKVYYHKENAMLYNRNDWKGINCAVKELLNDDNLRKKISNNAYADFLKKYSWKSRMKTLIDKIKIIGGEK